MISSTSTIVGMLTAIGQGVWQPSLPEYASLSVTSLISLLACVAGTLATAPTDTRVLEHFFRRTRPFGFWGKIRGRVPREEVASIASENRWDLLSGAVALVGFFFFVLSPMYLVIHLFSESLAYFTVAALAAVVLYFTWYKRLAPSAAGPGQG